jgi:hypothetical protein
MALTAADRPEAHRFIVANSKSLPVIVLHGEVHCPTALTTAQHYINNLAQSQGQGHFLTIDNWTCSWPNVEGRSHAPCPITTARTPTETRSRSATE